MEINDITLINYLYHYYTNLGKTAKPNVNVLPFYKQQDKNVYRFGTQRLKLIFDEGNENVIKVAVGNGTMDLEKFLDINLDLENKRLKLITKKNMLLKENP